MTGEARKLFAEYIAELEQELAEAPAAHDGKVHLGASRLHYYGSNVITAVVGKLQAAGRAADYKPNGMWSKNGYLIVSK